MNNWKYGELVDGHVQVKVSLSWEEVEPTGSECHICGAACLLKEYHCWVECPKIIPKSRVNFEDGTPVRRCQSCYENEDTA